MKDKLINWVQRNEVLAILLFSLFVLGMPFLLTRKWVGGFDNSTGVIGDTIGGATAPFVGIISALLVYAAFKSQNKANKEQRRANDVTNKRIDASSLLEATDRSYGKIEKYIHEFAFSGARGISAWHVYCTKIQNTMINLHELESIKDRVDYPTRTQISWNQLVDNENATRRLLLMSTLMLNHIHLLQSLENSFKLSPLIAKADVIEFLVMYNNNFGRHYKTELFLYPTEPRLHIINQSLRMLREVDEYITLKNNQKT